MSGTSIHTALRAKAGVSLPAPVVRLGKNETGFQPLVSDGPLPNDKVRKVDAKNIVTVSVHGIPQLVLDDLAKYKLQLELIRYKHRSTVSQAFARSFKTSGYVHPAHGPAPSGNGSYTHGGGVSQFSNINAIRETEWTVTHYGQLIDVTQGMHGFMMYNTFAYRDNTGNIIDAAGVMPAGRGNNTRFGKRMPYSGRFRPGYYTFRWSIIDPSDRKGQRIYGPESKTISLTTEVFPFLPEPTLPDGKTTASISPTYNDAMTQAWLGSVSRLPR
jgi:hypothetical protein